MNEIELKLQVPAERRAAVDAAVAGRTPAPRVRLQAAYFDTAGRALAEAALALRLRREDRRWVQTLKAATDDGMTRMEHNLPRGAAAPMPAIDPALHAGTPAGALLALQLAAAPDARLQTLYRTDILRRTRVLQVRAAGRPPARVELAFDSGSIFARDTSVDVCELEIEWLAGSPRAVLDTARVWRARFGLWLDLRSKAERGDLLARGETVAPAKFARSVSLAADMDSRAAWQAVLRSCAEQILANASQIAAGAYAPEHVHQLRVGLRRLRSALALFGEGATAFDLRGGAASLFRGLGAMRDLAVIEAEFGADLRTAMRSAGLAADEPPPEAAIADLTATELLRSAPSQTLLFDLLDAVQAGRADAVPAVRATAPPVEQVATNVRDATPLRARLAARLNRWHRGLVADAERYAMLDDTRRHRLRKHAKRLRYAAEFSAALFKRHKVGRYLKALRALQERLGAAADVSMAIETFARRAPGDADGAAGKGTCSPRHAGCNRNSPAVA